MSRSILVIEDDMNVRSLLQEVFEGEGYDVETAGDGLQAFQKIVRQYAKYDVILLDLVLPVIDGRCIIEYLQHNKQGWEDVLIVNSGDMQALHRMKEWGVRRYLAKPFELEKLLALVMASPAELTAGKHV